MKLVKSTGNLSLFIAIVLVLSACSLPTSSDLSPGVTSVWIDVPVDGLAVPEGQPVRIEGHAASPDVIRRVEIFLDGELVYTVNSPGMDNGLARFEWAWLPPGAGTFVIQAMAFDAADVASEPDSATIHVGGPPTEVPPASAVPPVTEEPPVTEVPPVTQPPAGAIIQFEADPATINAGDCTTLTWHVENVQKVVFGGAEQPFDGSYQDCLCADQIYTLTVTHLDGQEQQHQVYITVEGICETPEPQDTTPPPAPTPVVPANGLELTCRATQTLSWTPVTDEGGIARYEVQVQRHSGDNNWQSVSGSPFNINSGKSVDISVECGWYYRWRVRAVDGAGNSGAWAPWFTFTISLM